MTLKELRANAGFNAYEAARRLDVSYNAIWNWEHGYNGILKKYHKKLAKLYGVTVDELLAAVEESGKEVEG